MSQYQASTGIEVTDTMVDQWDADAERGIYHGEAGQIVVDKPLGRPLLYEEPMVPITFRVKGSEADALHAAAKRRGISLSDIMREACLKELKSQSS